jgi:hypothetical protein
MRPHLTFALLCTGLVAAGTFFGCTVPVDPGEIDEETATTEEAYMARPESGFFSIRKNTDCKIRFCSGYFVKEVNSRRAERHVDMLRFVDDGVDELALGKYGAIPDGGLVVRGFIGRPEGPWAKKPFVVMNAFRGMPGVGLERGDAYYRVSNSEHPYVFLATELNGKGIERLLRLDVTRVVMPHVDMEWLKDRVMRHGAVVAGHMHPITDVAGTLDVSQIYLHLPDARATCRAVEPVCADPNIPAYTRDAERCLVFDTCIAASSCPMPPAGGLPDPCAEGYRAVRWTADIKGCTDVACEPEFVSP